jgi:NAD(P)-dependent dehydrogenase (short-subunit alcohol dehydrogenase family)
MGDVFFITDVDTPLGKELAKLALQQGYTVFGTVAADNEGNDEQKTEKTRAAIEGKKAKETLKIEVWRRHSPVSARHILIKALTHFNTLDNIILLGNPVIERYELRQIPIQQIESLVDGWVKGNFFLVKELLNHFSQNGNQGKGFSLNISRKE